MALAYDLVGIAHVETVVQYSKLAAFAVLYYDYFLTLSEEIRYFWDPRYRMRTGTLFLINRYVQLFGNVAILLQDFGQLSDKCFVVVTQTFVGVFLLLRTYAIFEKCHRVLVIIFIIVAVLFVVAVWAVVAPSRDSIPVQPPPNLLSSGGCATSLSAQQSQRMAVVWGGVLFGDTVILSLTAFRAFQLRKSAASGMLRALLLDGCAYYLAISLANSINIVTFTSPEPVLRGSGTSIANVVAAVSVSRMMLNLRSRALSKHPSPHHHESFQGAITADIVISSVQGTHLSFLHDVELNNSESHGTPSHLGGAEGLETASQQE